MTFRKLILAAASAVAVTASFATASFAGDFPAKRGSTSLYSTVPVSNWDGLYVGASAGYGRGVGSNASIDTGFGGTLDTNANPKGGLLGLELGYRWQFGSSFVAGVRGNYNLSAMKGSDNPSATVFGFVPIGAEVKNSVDRLWSVRAEAGFLLTDNVLLSGNIGYGGVHANAHGVGTIFGSPFMSFDQDLSKNGLVYGARLDYKLPHNWSVAVDWSRYQPGSADLTLTSFAGTTVVPVDLKVDTFMVHLDHKFDLF